MTVTFKPMRSAPKRSSAAKAKPSAANRPRPPAKEDGIAVRMYSVGFGDCFLLRIPTTAGERRVLVDCGFHSLGKGRFTDREIVEQISADLAGQGLDVVIATHRHQDHISGFGETDLWKDIRVEEVWLPFTAEAGASAGDHSLAAWERLIEAAPKLVDRGGRLAPIAASALASRSPAEAESAAFLLWNARSNAPGIDNLLKRMTRADGHASRRRFLPQEGTAEPTFFETAVLPGVKVHVLGPPRDPEHRKKKKAPGSWGIAEDDNFRLADGAVASPFGVEWRAPESLFGARPPFNAKSLERIGAFNSDLFAAAKALDGFINGESLVLMLEIGSARLLLTGDAEVGSWTRILGNPKALEIASSATFLKVGHHGSHNATPLVFLKEHLAEHTPAMMSTQEGKGSYRRGIPRGALLDLLEERNMPLGRSDVSSPVDHPMFKRSADGKWVDCVIPC